MFRKKNNELHNHILSLSKTIDELFEENLRLKSEIINLKKNIELMKLVREGYND